MSATIYTSYHFDEANKIVWFWDGTKWTDNMECQSAEMAEKLFLEKTSKNIEVVEPVVEKKSVIVDVDKVYVDKKENPVNNIKDFFTRLNSMNIQCKLTFIPGANATLIFQPITFSKDETYNNLPPISFSGTPEEIDALFFETISKPVESLKASVSQADSFMLELEERKKNDAKAKAEKEAEKSKYTKLETAVKAFKPDDEKTIKALQRALKAISNADPENTHVAAANELLKSISKPTSSEQVTEDEGSLLNMTQNG